VGYAKMIKVNKPKCSKCKKNARLYHEGWWCGIKSYMGSFNMRGYCTNEKKRSKGGDKD
tara:strand:+ start:971 stop:1147 length:177 start_codon:yes stop_codon:yes gene_type:complete